MEIPPSPEERRVDEPEPADDDPTAPKCDPRCRHVSIGTTTSIASRFLVDLLDAAGRPVDDVLARAGVAREALAGPESAMPLDAFRELWARAAAVQADIGITLV